MYSSNHYGNLRSNVNTGKLQPKCSTNKVSWFTSAKEGQKIRTSYKYMSWKQMFRLPEPFTCGIQNRNVII